MTPKLFLGAWLLLCAATASMGQIPHTISYQGFLAAASGKPAPDGNYTLTVKLYSTENGGMPLRTETQSVAINDGVFSMSLGQAKPLALAPDKMYWLEHSVGMNSEIAPRVPFAGAEYNAKPGRAWDGLTLVSNANLNSCGGFTITGCLIVNGSAGPETRQNSTRLIARK